MRRNVPVVLAVLVALALVVTGSTSWAQKGPIKMGMVTSLTGGLAPNGKDMVNGMQLFLDEQGGKIAGRQVQLITEDDEGKPAVGLTKARALVESQGVHLLIGPVSAAIGYAIGPYVDGQKMPTIHPIVAGEDVENREKLMAAIRKVDLSASPRGPIKFDDYGNPIQNIYVRKVERVGGKLQNTVIHTFPNVSQFWKDNPAEFLKNPVYSRDYPPCKHC